MNTTQAGKSSASKTLGGLIVLLIITVGFAGIGYAVGRTTGAISVTLIGLVLFGLLYAWPSLTTGAEQTGLGKLITAPFALIASLLLFVPAVIVGLFRRLKAQRDAKHGIESSEPAAPVDSDEDGKSRSFFYGRWMDATTLCMFLINAVVGLIIALIVFGPMALTVFAIIATPVFLVALFFVGLTGSNPELAKPQPGEEVDELTA